MSSLHSLFTQLWAPSPAHVSSVPFLRHSFGRMWLAFAELVHEVFCEKERAKKKSVPTPVAKFKNCALRKWGKHKPVLHLLSLSLSTKLARQPDREEERSLKALKSRSMLVQTMRGRGNWRWGRWGGVTARCSRWERVLALGEPCVAAAAAAYSRRGQCKTSHCIP